MPARRRAGRAVLGAAMIALCLSLAGAAPAPVASSPAFLIAGMDEVPSPPRGDSWAPAPVDAAGLRMVAGADGPQFQLHTADGKRTFLPGVDLGGTTPGHQADDMTISAAQYRAWFAAMGWLGLRAVRIYTIHPPAFYQQLAAYNQDNPDRPLYLFQGVGLTDEAYAGKRNLFDKSVTDTFRAQVADAAKAVAGELRRPASPRRPTGAWTADVTPWLAGWILGSELDPQAIAASDRRNRSAAAVSGKYFRSTGGATPTEKWLAARMNELAGLQVERGVSQPIAFVNWSTTDPLRHPDEPLEHEDLVQLDANRVRPTADWPAGTFASYHAYPFYPDFQRYERELTSYQYDGQADPYAGYVTALRKHHAEMPTLITEFGVPSSLGSAHNAPLGRHQGGHSEQEAMRINGELLRLIHDQGAAAGFVAGWADEWYRYTWNTITHQAGARRQMWHDPLTNEQHFGLLATDATGDPGGGPKSLLDADEAWPARKVTARVDEAYVNLDVDLGGTPPGSLIVGFDVLPGMTGEPMTGSTDRRPDAVFALNLVGHTGQAYVRDRLDPLALDYDVPASVRGAAPRGWKPFELITNRDRTVRGVKLPIELQNAGLLQHGVWDPADPAADSRSLWRVDGKRLTIRVPWALLGFADPSTHLVGVPAKGRLSTETSPGVTVSLTASGTDQAIGQVTWSNWNRPGYAERLKLGASAVRDAALTTTSD